MPRPRKCRQVGLVPRHNFYKPSGVPLHSLVGINLPVDGFEALRLADAKGLDHSEAAALMGISRPTFSRILNEARRTVASALSNGWAISIDGGDFEVVTPARASRKHGRRRGRCQEET